MKSFAYVWVFAFALFAVGCSDDECSSNDDCSPGSVCVRGICLVPQTMPEADAGDMDVTEPDMTVEPDASMPDMSGEPDAADMDSPDDMDVVPDMNDSPDRDGDGLLNENDNCP